ncbi:class II aldolase/adducin N-terminal [Tribonema minus]|uniref:Probable methylthioribulose-1-phosphate dehydratase n=1 Tax=Tribonema minus TaxID=303371 RepID=A0A835Z2U4_9STRA|nr:class II aldolase/adducin N-terminal [Tribonema minus]
MQDEQQHDGEAASASRKRQRLPPAEQSNRDVCTLVVQLCRQFYHLGWVTGTGGSISIRRGDRLFMTPSGVQKERMEPEDLFVLDLDGRILEQPGASTGTPLKLSACAPLFQHAYKLRDAGAVLHSHGMYCVLACCIAEKQGHRDEFRCTHLEMIKGLAGHGYHDDLVIPIIENTAHEEDLADSLAAAIRAHPRANAVLVRRHGLYVWGPSWEKAKTQSECLHYLFECVVRMAELGADAAAPPPRCSCATAAVTAAGGSGGAAAAEAAAPRVVLLDIEGTTTPITFVKDTLFPYSIAHADAFLRERAADAEVQRLMREVAAASADAASRAAGAPLVAVEGSEDFIGEVAANVRWNVEQDRKVPPVKDLQGLMWRVGYESGELQGAVYDDVPRALRRWSAAAAAPPLPQQQQQQQRRVAIYSSGSRRAQRLLFRHSAAGDLTPHIAAYFDVKSAGPKRDARSYAEIALSLGVEPRDILFLTDVEAEAAAARAAGCVVIVALRPGNAPLPAGHGYATAADFDAILA